MPLAKSYENRTTWELFLLLPLKNSRMSPRQVVFKTFPDISDQKTRELDLTARMGGRKILQVST
jgi:hypothetical protein